MTLQDDQPVCKGNSESSPGPAREPCGVFPVESGGPVIGVGILLILAAVIPIILGINQMAFPAVILFGAFGVFLIILGFTK